MEFNKKVKKSKKENSSNLSTNEEEKKCLKTPNTSISSRDTKLVKVVYDSQLTVKVSYKKSEQENLTCEWLIKEVLRSLKALCKQKNLNVDFASFIGLQTQDKNIQLDYLLTISEKDLTSLPDTITLLPVHSIPSSKNQKGKGHVSQSDFEILSILAEGASCSVFIARKKDNGKIYAIKRVGKKALSNFDKTSTAVRTELSVLRKVCSNFIVKLHYTYQTNNFYHFVLDYVPGGDLFFYLIKQKKFSEANAKYYVAEILLALKEIHSQHIIYRDLKPENVLIDVNGHAILADFGLSKQVEDFKSLNTSNCGTEQYMAPELIGKKGYNHMIDFYSLGVLTYELLVGRTPFVCKSSCKGEFFENVQKKEPQIPAKFSPELQDFLSGLLCKAPNKRLGSARGADEILAHTWFIDLDVKKLAKREIPAPLKVDLKQLNHVLSELDLTNDCELDEDNPKVGKSVRMLSRFSFSEEIGKGSPNSVSNYTEETDDPLSDDEVFVIEAGSTDPMQSYM